MSYIVPRDKPQECMKCPYINQYNDCRLIWRSERIRTVEEQYQHCPLIEVPTPHGRLIDADELKTAFPACDNSMDIKVASVRATINHMPTVIEAEE